MRIQYKKIQTGIIWLLGAALIGGSMAYAANDGRGGTDDLLNIAGVGARALALGNAYVAMPTDATAVYWNPAGMDYIQKKNVSFFHTNLIVTGSSYQYLGYVHPTINIGTFGAAAIRLGVTDIEKTDNTGVSQGVDDFSQNLFLFSYGKILPYNLAIGVSLKMAYMSILGSSDTGVGGDFALMYRPNFTNIFLSNLSVGLNFQNILAPRLKLDKTVEALPHNIKIGLAKPLAMTEWGNQFMLFLDFEQGGGSSSPFKYHTGTEYIFQDRAMLRIGMNNNSPAFGAGAIFNMFQLDYSYGKFADNPLNPSHRLSFTWTFGSSKDELIRIAEQKRIDDINRKAQEQYIFTRRQTIASAMERGKRYMEEGEWIRAQQEFARIIGYENEMGEDAIEIREAKDNLKYVNDKRDEQQRKELADIQARNQREQAEHKKRIYINDQNKKAMGYFEHEEYEKAIAEWQKILDRYPDEQISARFIEEAKKKSRTEIYTLISRAENLGRKKEWVAAIKMLNRANELNPDTKTRDEIVTRRSRYENQMNFWDLFTQGVNYELQKNWRQAMISFDRALKLQPNNKEVKKRYRDVEARANARKEPMEPEVRRAYARSLRLIQAGKYEDALDILEEAQKIQRYSKEILDAIDSVKDRIAQQKRNQ